MKQGWEIKKLEELAIKLLAGGDKPKVFSEHPTDTLKTPVYANGVSLDGLVGYTDKAVVNKESITISARGTIGFCCVRKTPFVPIVRLITVIPNENIKTEFLYYALSNATIENNGVAIPQLTIPMIKGISIPVPPREEQERIVAELDCLSGVIEKKKQQLKELDALAQSIFYQMFGDIDEVVPLSVYIEGLSAGKSLAGDEECSNKVLKTGAVTYDVFDATQVKNLPLEYAPMPSHKVNAKDVLISRMNTAELVGACAYVWEIDDNIYLPDRLWRAEIKDNSVPIYLWKAITSNKAKEQIRSYASGTSGSMKNISKPSLMKVLIPNAPLSLQQEFAEKIEAIEKQKELIKQSIAQTEELFNSRMDYYFN